MTSQRERDGYMTQIAITTPEPQRMRALEKANEVRLARARLKRSIADGRTSAADVVLALPWEARNWSVGELLMSQRRWGSIRARKLLAGLHISEKRPIGELTERQRRVLAALLEAGECGERSHVPCDVPVSLEPALLHPQPVPALELVGA